MLLSLVNVCKDKQEKCNDNEVVSIRPISRLLLLMHSCKGWILLFQLVKVKQILDFFV